MTPRRDVTPGRTSTDKPLLTSSRKYSPSRSQAMEATIVRLFPLNIKFKFVVKSFQCVWIRSVFEHE